MVHMYDIPKNVVIKIYNIKKEIICYLIVATCNIFTSKKISLVNFMELQFHMNLYKETQVLLIDLDFVDSPKLVNQRFGLLR